MPICTVQEIQSLEPIQHLMPSAINCDINIEKVPTHDYIKFHFLSSNYL